MNKTELVAAIAEKAELSKKDSEKALKAFVDVVTAELKKEEKIQLVGFGTFEVSKRAAREGRNPQTGKTMKIEACKAPSSSQTVSLSFERIRAFSGSVSDMTRSALRKAACASSSCVAEASRSASS